MDQPRGQYNPDPVGNQQVCFSKGLMQNRIFRHGKAFFRIYGVYNMGPSAILKTVMNPLDGLFHIYRIHPDLQNIQAVMDWFHLLPSAILEIILEIYHPLVTT
jgi:hypothetical protein